MTRYICTSFEFNDLGDAYTFSGSVSLSSTSRRTGSYALRVTPSGSTPSYASFGAINSSSGQQLFAFPSSLYIRVYVRFVSFPSSNECFLAIGNNATTLNYMLRVSSSGALELYDKVGTTSSVSSVFQLNRWYRVEMWNSFGTGAQTITIKVDGATVITGAYSTGTNSKTLVHLGKWKNNAGASFEALYDDLVADDTDWVGDSSVVLVPCGNGFTDIDFSGNWEDAVAYDQNILKGPYSDVEDAERSLGFPTALQLFCGTVKSVNLVRITLYEGDSAEVYTSIVVPGAESELVTPSLPEYAPWVYVLRSVNPDTSAAWKMVEVPQIEMKIRLTMMGAYPIYLVYAGMYVEYIPQPSPSAHFTVSRRKYSERLLIHWTSDEDGNASIDVVIRGYINRIVSVPVDGPTDNYDITISDASTGYEVLRGVGMDRDTSNTETAPVYLALDSYNSVRVSHNFVARVEIANAGAFKSGAIAIYSILDQPKTSQTSS